MFCIGFFSFHEFMIHTECFSLSVSSLNLLLFLESSWRQSQSALNSWFRLEPHLSAFGLQPRLSHLHAYDSYSFPSYLSMVRSHPLLYPS